MTDAANIPDANFGFVRYANCWEDPRLLIGALQPATGKRILSIASAGDNALALLASGATVVAADLNPAQIACTELRLAAIRALDQPAFLRFSGIVPANDRVRTYQVVRPSLAGHARRYWDTHGADLVAGFIHAGKFERYFRLFRTCILPLIHHRATIEALLQPKELAARRRFYTETWDNRRWQLLFRVFFGRRMMGHLGRDPAFFRHVEGAVAARILERARYGLTELDVSANPYLRYVLTGNFGPALPYYLQPEPYAAIRDRIDNLVLHHGAIDAVAATYGADSFDGYNLSDIFEYLTLDQCAAVYARLLASARPGARFAYWNMLAPRTCPAPLTDRVMRHDAEADALFRKDQAVFYSRFVIEERR